MVGALPPEAEALVQGTIQRLRDGYFVTAEYGRRDWWTDSVPVILRDLARRLLEPGEKERDALREKATLLHRRCQSAESGLAEKLEQVGHSFGRGLANSAATFYREKLHEAEQSLFSLRADGWLEKAAEEIASDARVPPDHAGPFDPGDLVTILKRHRDGAA